MSKRQHTNERAKLKEEQGQRPATHLTPGQVAERYHLHPNTLSNWRVVGSGPRYIKVGGRVLYPVVEIETWEADILRNSTVEDNWK